MRERPNDVGPDKHGAKHKTFVTVFAWSVFLNCGLEKPHVPMGGFPRPLKAKGEEKGKRRGILTSSIYDLYLITKRA
jgi:hypothetical protein